MLSAITMLNFTNFIPPTPMKIPFLQIEMMILSIMISASCLAQNTQDSIWIREHYIKKEMYIPMRDGVRLFTSVYIPKDTTEKHPILMQRTPYSVAPYGHDGWKPFLWAGYPRYFTREGYIMVYQDVRGTYMSEGD